MHPELEDFLENAFDDVPRLSPGVGRVVVEPDYDVAPDETDRARLSDELQAFLSGRSELGEARIDEGCHVLKKYLRSVRLYADSVDGPWIEVAPPGNWI